jgi:hypothetical protein
MDLSHPLRSLIPGVQGRLLEALALSGQVLTSGQASRIANCSENQASTVLRSLAELGLVDRTEAGRTAQYRLSPNNYAAQKLLEISGIRNVVYAEMSRLSKPLVDYDPAVWIAVFGSTARGSSDQYSDIDVAIVRPDGNPLSPQNPDDWDQMEFAFTQHIANLCSNQVNVVKGWRSEVNFNSDFWSEVLRDQVTVAGLAPVPYLEHDILPPTQEAWSLFWPSGEVAKTSDKLAA